MDLLLAITSKSESASINLTKLPPSKLATTSIATQSLDSGNGSTEDNVFVLTISGTVTLTVQSASDSCSLGEVFLIDSRESAPEPGGLKLATKTETRVQVSAKNVNGRLINKDEMRNANGALLAHGLLTPPRHFKTGPPPGLGNRQGISHIKEESINSQPDLPTITISMTPEIVVTPASDGLEVEDPYKSFFESLRQQDSKLLRVPCYPRGPKRLPRHLDWTDEAFHEMKNCMDGIQEKDEIAIKVFGTPIRRTPRTSLDSLTEADTRKGDRYTSRPKWRKSLDVQATRWGSMISNIVGNPTLSTGSRTATAQLHDALQSRPPLGQYGRSRDDQATPAKRRYEDNEDLCYRERIEYENEARRRAIESIVLKPSRGGRRDSLDPRNSHDARQVALSTVNMRRAGVDKPTGRPTGTGNKENVTGATNGNCLMYMNYYSNVRQQRTSLPTASQCPTTPTNPSYPNGPSTSRIPTRSSSPRARYNDRESTTAFEKKEGLDQRKRPRLSDSNIPTASGSTGNKPRPNLRLGHSKSEEVKP